MQSEALGNVFRTVMYPMNGPAGGGLLRLHSTYRHDLKIYSSDEGRVQMSAAAFTQGLLDLEGSSLTPILVRQGSPIASGRTHGRVMHGNLAMALLGNCIDWHLERSAPELCCTSCAWLPRR